MNVKAFFGGAEVFSIEEEKVLMAESTRKFEQVWAEAPLLGIFNVAQEITLLGDTHLFTGVAVICPLWLIIMVIIAIVIAIICIAHRNKRRQKR